MFSPLPPIHHDGALFIFSLRDEPLFPSFISRHILKTRVKEAGTLVRGKRGGAGWSAICNFKGLHKAEGGVFSASRQEHQKRRSTESNRWSTSLRPGNANSGGVNAGRRPQKARGGAGHMWAVPPGCSAGIGGLVAGAERGGFRGVPRWGEHRAEWAGGGED